MCRGIPPVTRAALYARVSTHEQDVEVQLRELRDYAARRQWVIAGEYTDEGVSGAVPQRPALTRLLAAARRRHFDVLLVWKFDRFARSARHLLLMLEECRHRSIQFVSLTEHIDTNSPLGEAMFTIIAALAAFERSLIIERVHAGLRKARADGKRLGRPPAIVNRTRIAELQHQGLSFRAIGRRLGLPPSTVFKYRDPQLRRAQDQHGRLTTPVTQKPLGASQGAPERSPGSPPPRE